MYTFGHPTTVLNESSLNVKNYVKNLIISLNLKISKNIEKHEIEHLYKILNVRKNHFVNRFSLIIEVTMNKEDKLSTF